MTVLEEKFSIKCDPSDIESYAFFKESFISLYCFSKFEAGTGYTLMSRNCSEHFRPFRLATSSSSSRQNANGTRSILPQNLPGLPQELNGRQMTLILASSSNLQNVLNKIK